MADTPSQPPPADLPPDLPAPHVIIAGFGLPGRFVAELLDFRNIPYTVIEQNPQIVTRVGACGTRIIGGDVREESVLRAAGIESARILALCIPDEKAACDATAVARRLAPSIRIIARCHYTSAGLRAHALGADDVIVAEQLVAREFFKAIDGRLNAEGKG